jgi:hypothetical protein
MSEDYKVAFSRGALGDVPPDDIARIAVDMQTRLTTGGIEGLIEDSSVVHFVEDANVRCLVCDGPLGPDRDFPAYPGMLRCFATPACTKKNLYLVQSSQLGRELLGDTDDDTEEHG